MAIATRVTTRTHTANYLSGEILGAFSDILAHLGLSGSAFGEQWPSTEAALVVWIQEGSLEKVRLECMAPSGAKAFFEVAVMYDESGIGESQFVSQQLALARCRAKFDSMPRTSTYRLLVWTKSWRTAIAGWTATTEGSTAGLIARSFGTLASAPHASASLRYFRS